MKRGWRKRKRTEDVWSMHGMEMKREFDKSMLN